MKNLLSFNRIGVVIMLVCTIVFQQNVLGQCTNAFAFGTAAAPTNNTPLTISSCTYQQEYNTITGIVAGSSYTSTYDLGGCITVRSGTPGGPVVAFGTSPLAWVAPSSGTYYIHYNVNCVTCAQATSCGVTTITCTSCSSGGPCASITPLIGCGASIGISVSGPGTWDVGACGFSTPGLETIYSIVAPLTGNYSIDVTSITGGFIDFMWVDAASGCSPTAGWNCIADVVAAGNYGPMNWVAGNTYYILVDPEGTGAYTVSFDVNCPSSASVAGDCPQAIPICTNVNFSIDPNGYGLIDELCQPCTSNPNVNPASANSGCLLSGELNSTWYEINVSVGGTLEFSFGAPGGGNCYDWIMWPKTPTVCADIVAGTQAPVRCNWNGTCDSYTGIAGTIPAGGFANNFEPPLTVTAGQQFLICFSNFSSAYTNVPLDFFGTADISCVTLPVEFGEFFGERIRGKNELFWSTLSEVNCDHFDVERSADGIEFTKVGEVKGAGTHLSLSEYTFTDETAPSGIMYYRIKQLDHNGAYAYSKVITIESNLGEIGVLRAYPNPTSELLSVEVLLGTDANLQCKVTDLRGRRLAESTQAHSRGMNKLEFNVRDFSMGSYLLIIENVETKAQEVIRFVVN